MFGRPLHETSAIPARSVLLGGSDPERRCPENIVSLHEGSAALFLALNRYEGATQPARRLPLRTLPFTRRLSVVQSKTLGGSMRPRILALSLGLLGLAALSVRLHADHPRHGPTVQVSVQAID